MKILSDCFQRNDVELVETETAYQGFFRIIKYSIKHRLFNGGWSQVISRELFIRGEAAAAILYDPVLDRIGLVEQFRVGALDSEFGPWCLEAVAGMMEPNETAEGLIRRELVEEAGIEDVRLIPISSYYSTPGGCGEKIHLFCGLCSLDGAGGLFGLPEEGEDIRFQSHAAQDVFDTMLDDRTNNAATLLGLLWLQLNRERLRSEI
ncbi:MAG: ADP-ribose pyrophosphatase [Flavobacteriales bacterium]|jgi:ADP-ribose pyrophosphatase